MPGDAADRLLPVGRALKAAREKAALTQEQLAFEAEVDRTYLSYLENDLKSPTVDMLCRICQALDLAVSDLIAAAESSIDS